MSVWHPARFVVLAAIAAAAYAGGGLLAQRTASAPPSDSKSATRGASDTDSVPPPARHPVHINRPAGPPRIATGQVDALGREISISCASCHANLTPNTATSTGADLAEFHEGLHFEHHGLACVSCHNSEDYNTLRMADGRPLPFSDVQLLCGQCHAPQVRDYEHGAHGGMTGYWDLSRGPRHRKNCIDCHDPHAPAFPTMVPTFKPFDRFLPQPSGGGTTREASHD